MPNLSGCDDTGPYIGYYGDDIPGVFSPVTPDRGVYYDGGEFDIPAGTERTQCTYEILDVGEDFVLGRYEARMNPDSHHFNMVRYDAAVLAGQAIELGKPRDCIAAADVPFYVAGSEWQYVDAPLPDGLGHKIPRGALLELGAHYVNTTDHVITGRVEANLYSRNAAEVDHYIGLYFNIMKGFEVAPNTRARFKARCPAQAGVSMVLLTSHMHRFGRDFTIGLYDDQLGTLTPLYESLDYSHPKIKQMATDPLVIGAGQGFEWSCEFENTMTSTLSEGEMGLTSEMCIMVGFYYDDPGGLPYCLQTATPVP